MSSNLLSAIAFIPPIVWLVTILASVIVATVAYRLNQTRLKGHLEAVKDFGLRQQKGYAEAKASLEKLREKISRQTGGSMVIDIVHDFGGFLFDRDSTPKRITSEQAIEVMNAVRSTKKHGPIVVIVHTLGGYSFATELIAAALKNHSGPTSVYVPYIAMSGGTMVALAADKIHLGKNASLGPIGTMYWGYSFETLKKLHDLKKVATKDENLLDYYEAEVANRVERTRIKSVMNKHHEERALDRLLRTDVPHDYRITFEQAGKDGADKVGLHVFDKCPDEIYQYVELRLLMIKKFEDAGAAE